MTIGRKNSKIPVSAFIICKNEEDRISYAIKSVIDLVDEVVLVDSGSTDKTLEIVKKLGVSKVFYNEWKGYGQQKLFAEKKCKNDWVLNIDADEEVTPRLQEELKRIFGKNPQKSAYYIDIKICSRFTDKVPPIGPEDIVIRLYNKKTASYSSHEIHDTVKVKSGATGKLKNYIKHRCFISYEHAVNKINFYTSMQAQDMLKKNRCPSVIRIAFEPLYAFIKAYFINKYIFLGVEGFIEAVIYAFSKTLRLAKARELYLVSKRKR
jgi:glycosyltransferase involved in cell wall biosynthesis